MSHAAILDAITLLIGAIGSSLAGYNIEALILRDGERAIAGFAHGFLVFTATASLLFLIYRSKREVLSYAWITLLALAWLVAFVAGWMLER